MPAPSQTLSVFSLSNPTSYRNSSSHVAMPDFDRLSGNSLTGPFIGDQTSISPHILLSSRVGRSSQGIARAPTPAPFSTPSLLQGGAVESDPIIGRNYASLLDGGSSWLRIFSPAYTPQLSPTASHDNAFHPSHAQESPQLFHQSMSAECRLFSSQRINNDEDQDYMVPAAHERCDLDPSQQSHGSNPSITDGLSFDGSNLRWDGSYTGHSDSSLASVESLASSTPRRIRRRRRRKDPVRNTNPERQKFARRYQCTFCTDNFKTKYDWQRHETSIHLSLEQWECAKSGPFTQEPDGPLCCVFCGQLDPTPDHLSTHNYSTCLAKPPEDRIFRRKDHLRQHLRVVHAGCPFNEKMEAWFSSIEMVNSRCGFCNALMTSWTERQKHLARHFKCGADMKTWKGDRGFDEHIEGLVENDMPVFMIGDQRNTMEPFSASQAGHYTKQPELDMGLMNDVALPGDRSFDLGIPSSLVEQSHAQTVLGPHSYRQVESLLLAYVKEELGNGQVPSDTQLKTKMSEIMFGPDNEWDQTWADNAQWLEMFKQKAGLVGLAHSGGRNAFIGLEE